MAERRTEQVWEQLKRGLGVQLLDFDEDEDGKVVKLVIWDQAGINLEYFRQIPTLKILELDRSPIENLNELACLTELISLNISFSKITNISPLKNLKNLQELSLGGNSITDISPLSDLTTIIELRLDDNMIADISPLTKLFNLETFSASRNSIVDISPISNFKKLTSLGLDDNEIDNVHALSKLVNLTDIDLRNNTIQDIRPLMPFIEKGLSANLLVQWDESSINLYNNPLTTPPIEIVQKGNEAILDWFANYQKEQTKGELPLHEAKMIIIGEPDAGKTSLMNYLLGKPFTVPKTTEGFKRERWPVKRNDTDYRINIWDFGGQEIQSTVHQFFLTQDTLYIVVLNARKDEKPDPYLEQIKSYAPDSPVIIVLNQVDENASAAIDENRLKELYKDRLGQPLLKAVFKTSVLKGHRDNDPNYLPALKALEQSIADELMQLPNINTKVPVTYFDVKEYLEGDNFRGVPFITKDTFEQICEDKNLDKASNNDLLLRLNNLGTVRYFDDLQRRNLHILNPEWLSDGVYRILMHPKTHEYKGIITETDFAEILQKTADQQFSYPQQYYHFLIQMIETFNLGYFEKETGKIFIPRAFGKDYPAAFNPSVYKKDAIHFFFKYETFIPSPIISGFIARMFGKVVDSLYWQNGMVLQQTDMGETQTALVEQNDIKNRIDIWVTGQHRQAFFIELRSIFREFHDKRQGLVVDEMIGLDERRDTAVKYKVLLAHKMKDKNEYTDDEANDYNISSLLGMFESAAVTSTAINTQFNINNYGRLHIGNIQIIRNEAQQISTELTALLGELGEQHKAIASQLLEGIQAIQQSKSSEQAKGIFGQLRDTIKNFTKISSEEAVKWGTRKILDSQTIHNVFNNIVNGINSLGHHFVDYIRPENML
jgi:internalin A